MGLFTQYKEQLRKLLGTLTPEQEYRDKIVQEHLKQNSIRVDRHYAQQELDRWNKQVTETQQFIDEAKATPEEIDKAKQDLSKYKRSAKKSLQKVEELTTCLKESQQNTKNLKTADRETRQQHRDEVVQGILGTMNMQLEGAKDTVAVAYDRVTALPDQIKESSEKFADLAVATLATFTDTLHDTTEKAKLNGLHEFSKLPELGRSIDRAACQYEINLDTKSLESTNKLLETWSTIKRATQSFAERKMDDTRDVGKALGKLFGFKVKNTPSKRDIQKQLRARITYEDRDGQRVPFFREDSGELRQATAQEVIQAGLEEKDPDIITKFLENRKANLEDKLEKNYSHLIDSYEKTIEHELDIADRAGQTARRSDKLSETLEEKAMRIASQTKDKAFAAMDHRQELRDAHEER